MTEFHNFVLMAHKRAQAYSQCSPEQGLVYACEDIVDEYIGSTVIDSQSARQWLEPVCDKEDIDLPSVHIHPRKNRIRASSLHTDHSIHLYEPLVHASTLIHEVAHLMSDGHAHGIFFREEMIRLARAHISVEYAAMLHGLYRGCELHVSPWPASAQRR